MTEFKVGDKIKRREDFFELLDMAYMACMKKQGAFPCFMQGFNKNSLAFSNPFVSRKFADLLGDPRFPLKHRKEFKEVVDSWLADRQIPVHPYGGFQIGACCGTRVWQKEHWDRSQFNIVPSNQLKSLQYVFCRDEEVSSAEKYILGTTNPHSSRPNKVEITVVKKIPFKDGWTMVVFIQRAHHDEIKDPYTRQENFKPVFKEVHYRYTPSDVSSNCIWDKKNQTENRPTIGSLSGWLSDRYAPPLKVSKDIEILVLRDEHNRPNSPSNQITWLYNTVLSLGFVPTCPPIKNTFYGAGSRNWLQPMHRIKDKKYA